MLLLRVGHPQGVAAFSALRGIRARVAPSASSLAANDRARAEVRSAESSLLQCRRGGTLAETAALRRSSKPAKDAARAFGRQSRAEQPDGDRPPRRQWEEAGPDLIPTNVPRPCICGSRSPAAAESGSPCAAKAAEAGLSSRRARAGRDRALSPTCSRPRPAHCAACGRSFRVRSRVVGRSRSASCPDSARPLLS